MSVNVRRRIVIVFLINCIAYGCATTTQAPALPAPEAMHGEASWYGQEFAGRTTANGEIFDPLLMTAAHRSLPFGTIVDVKNPTNGQTVRVRINDRGPYVGNRLIDLTYAAAQQIGLIEPGHGEVDLTVVKVGRGDREPPAPYVVSIPDVAASPTTQQPRSVPAPAPVPAPVAAAPADVPPITVDRVEVVEEHASQPGVETRRVVGADGRTIESVPIAPLPASQPVVRNTPPPAPQPRPVASAGKFVVQVGAFSQEPNAKELQGRLTKIGQQSYVDHSATLYRVRIGPFATREQAIAARAKLEAAGISAIVVAP
ncbi:MAG: rare lipoprotein [Acidobacteriota bacterium]|nr:rare lipoprotein [Acidobacteriota bacterium]